MTRTRAAPSAARIASSRCRAAPRARSRFATFAHAINRTNATAPASTSSAGRTSPDSSSRSGRTITVQPASNCGNSAVSPDAMALICACAARTDTSGFSRATTDMNRPRGIHQSSGSTHGFHRSIGLPTSDPDFSTSRVSCGMTPMTVTGRPFNRMARPTIPGSPANRRCHSS